MCLYPKLIKNKKYLPNNKNGGNAPFCDDKRKLLVPIGCQKCIECRKKKSNEWKIRLLEDIKHNRNGKFVTLTFSDESIAELSKIAREEDKTLKGYDLDNRITSIAVRRFTERWRKENKKAVRHWLITEIGHNGTKNIHLHGIIWTDNCEKIERHWKYGFADTGEKNYVNDRTIGYITKYVTKVDFENKEYQQKIYASNGIGKGFMNRTDKDRNAYKGNKTITTYKTKTGLEQALPIYWRNKIYSEEEREELWVHMLDKQERWILGEKIDISKGDEEYYKVLEWAREKNKRLGYGDDEKDWDKIRYENKRRALKQEERIAKGIAKERSKAKKGHLGREVLKEETKRKSTQKVDPKNINGSFILPRSSEWE